jgi:hypothetical protein
VGIRRRASHRTLEVFSVGETALEEWLEAVAEERKPVTKKASGKVGAGKRVGTRPPEADNGALEYSLLELTARIDGVVAHIEVWSGMNMLLLRCADGRRGCLMVAKGSGRRFSRSTG